MLTITHIIADVGLHYVAADFKKTLCANPVTRSVRRKPQSCRALWDSMIWCACLQSWSHVVTWGQRDATFTPLTCHPLETKRWMCPSQHLEITCWTSMTFDRVTYNCPDSILVCFNEANFTLKNNNAEVEVVKL